MSQNNATQSNVNFYSTGIRNKSYHILCIWHQEYVRLMSVWQFSRFARLSVLCDIKMLNTHFDVKCTLHGYKDVMMMC